MKIEQIYTGCLAQGAYYIESKGEVAIIDPLRETTPYIEKAKKDGATIKYVLETHFHADFVSGHLDLAKATGATIVFGPNAAPSYDFHSAKDGEELKIGDITLRVLHTPGHTMESTTYLLLDKDGKQHAIFTGDTLFLGDVGRPDLAAKSNLTEEQLAGHLYDSLRDKIMTLPDETIVYPGHGAGSACGKNMRKETIGTVGEEKATNYALRADLGRAEFVKELSTGLLPPPAYFPKNVEMNKLGYDSFSEVLGRGLKAYSPEAFEALANATGALVLDTRKPEAFVKGFIPKSIFIGIDGGFAPWVGALIPDIRQPILVVADEGRAEEVVTRLARVGYDHAIGFLEGGFEAWQNAGKETDRIESVSPSAFAKMYGENDRTRVIDVRKPSEFSGGHLINAENFPLDFINDHMGDFDQNTPGYVHCAGGYRSMIALSILRARGIDNLTNVEGGYGALKQTDIAPSEFVQPEVASS